MVAWMNYSENLPSSLGSHLLFSAWKSFPLWWFKKFNQVRWVDAWRYTAVYSAWGTWNCHLFHESGPLCLLNIVLLSACAQSRLDKLGTPLGNQPSGWPVPFWFLLLEVQSRDTDWVDKLRIGRRCWLKGSHCSCVPRARWVWHRRKSRPRKTDSERGAWSPQAGREGHENPHDLEEQKREDTALVSGPALLANRMYFLLQGYERGLPKLSSTFQHFT